VNSPGGHAGELAVQYRHPGPAVARTIGNGNLSLFPVGDSPAYHRCMMDLFHHLPLTIVLASLGVSVLVAGLDFGKRRAGGRLIPSKPPEAKIVAVKMDHPVPKSRTVAPIRRVASAPHFYRATPTLPVAGVVPMPKPKPQLLRNSAFNTSVSWDRSPMASIPNGPATDR
jgi:hypothetical protein